MAQQAFRHSVEAPVSEVASFLQDLLSRRVTAYIAGVKDARTITRWASGEITEIRQPASEQRLRTAYEIGILLQELESPQTIKAWFLSLNPLLDEVSPIEALREGRGKDVKAAAHAFAAYG